MSKDFMDDFFDDVQEVYDDPTIQPYLEDDLNSGHNPDFATSSGCGADEALVKCMNRFGYLDLPWMSQVSGLSVRELVEELKDVIIQDPVGYDQHHSDEEDYMFVFRYRGGNIHEKLAEAQRLDQKYPGRFQEQIRILKESVPALVPIDEIGISIGSSWIPAACYEQFLLDLLGASQSPKVIHASELGVWNVTAPDSVKKSLANRDTYGYTYQLDGTIKHKTALDIMEDTLNGSTIKIYKEVCRSDRKSGMARILMKQETIEVQEKQEMLQQHFHDWVFNHPAWARQLEKIFYENYVCMAVSRYDGSFLELPDLNPEFKPYEHQRNAVARIVLEKDVLINHAVGTGKTNVLIMGVHERYRMGLSRKNLVVVPNSVLEAFERAHHYLYPQDRILVIRPERFTPANRQAILEKIRDEDYAAIYMAFSSFDLLTMSRKYRLEQKAQAIAEARVNAANMKERWERHKWGLEAKKLEKDYQKMQKELPQDKYLPFDELGVTTLVVDEVHFYKNVGIKTRADGVVGMNQAGSRKCNEMMEKTQYVRSQNGGILFSTGTPLNNSIADLFVLQCYLQPEQLRLLGFGHFDEWIGSFASRVSGFEVDVDAANYRIMTRFAHFCNLPELTALFASVCDYYAGEDNREGIPECGDYIDVRVPRSPEQAEYIRGLSRRTDQVRQKLVPSHEDNLLKIAHDGRVCALDIREVLRGARPNPKKTKGYVCCEIVYCNWKKYPGTTQLIFCDMSTPKKGFNVYDEVKRNLMEMGVPEEQIAFIHDADTDAKRRKLFKAVNRAEVRILIGSTSKLGTGVNVQRHLIAVHHLDVPWKPSDIVQREGRMIRQGNLNQKVFRYRYVTEGTFDAYSWQVLETKQRFMGQFMSGFLADREMRDIDAVVFSYAEIKALCVGDPLIKTRIETANGLDRVKIHHRRRELELRRMAAVVDAGPERLRKMLAYHSQLSIDQKYFEEHREKMTRYDRVLFGEELIQELNGILDETKERLFDTLHGFDIYLPANMNPERPKVILVGMSKHRYEIEMRDAKGAGCVQRIEHLLLHFDERMCRVKDEIKQVKAEVAQAKTEIRKGNPYAKDVTELKKKLVQIDTVLNRRAEAADAS